jgi:hypothetical protein
MNMLTLSVPDHRGSLAAKHPDVVQAVQAVLCAPEEELDYARAKVALDLLIDPAQTRSGPSRNWIGLPQLRANCLVHDRRSSRICMRFGH